MKHVTLLLALGLAACGNLSNDDLLFLAGLPRAEELELDVDDEAAAGALSVSQALVGDASEYYAGAANAAHGINGMVDGLLGFVENLGRGHEPTRRSDDARIWGPIHLDDKDTDVRLEIRRDERGGGPRYTYCLHAGDRDGSGEPACGDAFAAGMYRVLWGTYEPRAVNEGVRSGTGEVHLDLDASQRAGSADGDEHGRLDLTYDFSRGGEEKQIHLEIAVVPAVGQVGQHAVYEYGKRDGRVDFYLEFLENKVGGGWGGLGSTVLETVILDAFWYENGPGRGDAAILGGDVGPDESVTATECWNAAHQRRYFRFDWVPYPERSKLEGDAAECPE